MAVFDELNEVEPIDFPDERQAQDIKRGKGKAAKIKKKSTSVSATQYQITMNIVSILVLLIVLGAAAFGIYYGFQLFIGGV